MAHKKSPGLIRSCSVFALALTLTVPASAEWKEKVLYSFQGLPDGSLPVGGIVFDAAGNLYGATTEGGSSSCPSVGQCGTVFQLTPPVKQGDPWTETVLYIFKGNKFGDGATPAGGLIIDKAGNLYGTTAYGGTGNCVLLGLKLGCGAVYELSPPKQKGGKWTETVLYSFPTAKQGYLPQGDLVFDASGNLYGATSFGGGHGTTCNGFYQYCGAVFELSPPRTKGGKWTEKVLHGFRSGTDGADPNGGLVLDSKGNVYGTTFGGGDENGPCGKVGCGTAFELKPPAVKGGGAWTEKILHRFTAANDGGEPNGGLVFDTKGALYGGANGGAKGGGVVFRLAATGAGAWKETVLYAFSTNTYGYAPAVGLFGPNGILFGTTYADPGNHLPGTVYEMGRSRTKGKLWTLNVLYNFKGIPDGAFPSVRLTLDGAGNLFSTTQAGGGSQACSPGGCGTVYEVSP